MAKQIEPARPIQRQRSGYSAKIRLEKSGFGGSHGTSTTQRRLTTEV